MANLKIEKAFTNFYQAVKHSEQSVDEEIEIGKPRQFGGNTLVSLQQSEDGGIYLHHESQDPRSPLRKLYVGTRKEVITEANILRQACLSVRNINDSAKKLTRDIPQDNPLMKLLRMGTCLGQIKF